MQAAATVCSVLLAGCSLAYGQVRPQVSTIQLRVLRGRNNKPVRKADVFITAVPITQYATSLERTTNAQGAVSLLVERDVQVRAVVSHYRTCRLIAKADHTNPPTAYAVSDILASGIVSDNHCSKRTVAPKPGELTLFVRPLHWWERLSY